MSREIYQKVKKSICKLNCRIADKEYEGTGFFYFNSKGRIFLISNHHVLPIEGNKDANICVNKDETNEQWLTTEEYKIVSFSITENWDWILIEILTCHKEIKNNFESVEFNRIEDCEVTDQVWFGGYPLDHNNLTFHKGNISSIFNDQNNEVKNIQIDGSINSGNSGGPLFDSDGKVIGIISKIDQGFETNIYEFEQNIIKSIECIKKLYLITFETTEHNNLTSNFKNFIIELNDQLKHLEGLTIPIDNLERRLVKKNDLQILIQNNILRSSIYHQQISKRNTIIIEGQLEVVFNTIKNQNLYNEINLQFSKDILYELKRTANVGIGFAHCISNLLDVNKDILK